MTWIYGFAHPHATPPRDLKDLLGGKGANLAEMTSVLGLPVPPGFTITTEACVAYLADGWPDGLGRRDRRARGRTGGGDGPSVR